MIRSSIRSKEGSSCGSCKCNKSKTNSSTQNGVGEEVVDMKISANGDVQTEKTAEGKVDILNAMKNLDF